jgi:hypothetical protein
MVISEFMSSRKWNGVKSQGVAGNGHHQQNSSTSKILLLVE